MVERATHLGDFQPALETLLRRDCRGGWKTILKADFLKIRLAPGGNAAVMGHVCRRPISRDKRGNPVLALYSRISQLERVAFAMVWRLIPCGRAAARCKMGTPSLNG